MKDLFKFRPTAGSRSAPTWMRRLAATPSSISKRGITMLLAGLMIPTGFAQLSAFAQDAPPPPPDQQQPQYDQGAPPPDENAAPPQQWNPLSPDQLNQLVAPIALYPDSLVAQVLAASTYPSQVADADRFVQSQAGAPPQQIAQMANTMNWDPSVKALCAFPSVLADMDKNLDWATQLGNAYYNQPQDVMNAVQTMRQQAYSRGDLRSGPQLNVEYAPNDIVIAPANPAVVYVPYYDPWAIWGFRPYYRWYAPPPPMGFVVGARFGFGVGVVVAPWGRWGWGFGHWGFAWGPHPYVAFNHVTYVSRSVTVVNHGYYGHFDRAPGARAYNVQAAHAAYAAGQRNGFNRGEANGYNRGVRNGYNNGYNRGAQGNYSRPATNYSRPATNYSRPATNYSRPGANYSRPGANTARPAQNNNYSRPGNQGRPAEGGHPQAGHPQGGHPQGGEHKGGEKSDHEGHPHGR